VSEASSGLAAALAQHSADCIEIIDLDGRLISINPPGLDAREIADPSPFIGRSWAGLWPSEAQAEADAAVTAARTGRVGNFSAAGPTAKGTPRWWAVTVAPVFDDDGAMDHLVAISRDITGVRDLVERLRVHEQFLREALEYNPHMFWVADREGTILHANGARLRFIGRPLAEVTGTGWARFIHPDDRESYRAAGNAAASSRASLDFTFRLQSGSGEYRWVRSRAYPKLDEQGRIERWYGYSEDVHEQKLALDVLDERERRLRTIQDTLPECVKVVSADGRLLEMNPAGLAMIEADSLDQVKGQAVVNLVIAEHRRAFVAYHRAALGGAAQPPLVFEIEGLRGTRRWLESRSTPLVDAEGMPSGVLSVTRDITERRAAEDELERLQRQALQASRLNAMGAMASTLAHELNQPLAATANYVAAARLTIGRGALDGDRLGEVLDLAEKEALRAGEIVRKLRGFVTRGEVATQPTEVRRLVADAMRLAASHGESVAPRLSIASNARRVLADPVQIEQVLGNLLRNAVEATSGQAAPDILISAKRHGSRFIRLTVRDNGPGVASDAARSLFSPFASTKTDGMGIGLSICRTIVEAHGGRIWHEAPPGGGAAFAFTLRCAGEP
jgi:PAS domain S-box-containing protein